MACLQRAYLLSIFLKNVGSSIIHRNSSISTILSLSFFKTNQHSPDQRFQLDNSNAGQSRTVRHFTFEHMFYMLYSGVRYESGGQVAANRSVVWALKGSPAVGNVVISSEGDRPLWGAALAVYASLNFRAQVHICAHTLDSILVRSPSFPELSRSSFFSHVKERRLSTSNLLALHGFNPRSYHDHCLHCCTIKLFTRLIIFISVLVLLVSTKLYGRIILYR